LLVPYRVSSNKIPYYLNVADVLVHTSYYEGSPNIIKEAMACNLPIVCTDVGDVSEVIGNVEGCYITKFDSKNVATNINSALNFGKKTKGREKIKHLELSVVARKIARVYKKATTL